MKRTLWSLLVGAAAVLPALQTVREATTAPAPASASRSLPDLRQIRRTEARAEVRGELRRVRLPSPGALALTRQEWTAPRSASGPSPELVEGTPVTRPALRLPPVRAPAPLG